MYCANDTVYLKPVAKTNYRLKTAFVFTQTEFLYLDVLKILRIISKKKNKILTPEVSQWQVQYMNRHVCS